MCAALRRRPKTFGGSDCNTWTSGAAGLLEQRANIVAGGDRIVARRIAGAVASFQAPNDRCPLRCDEERDGNTRLTADVGRPMQVGREKIVGPRGHQITEVHDEGIWNRRHVDPIAGGAPSLRMTSAVDRPARCARRLKGSSAP